jgi:hypothetical protein
MDKNDQTQELVNKTEGSGRINRPGKEVNEEEIASHDISQVDRQEGEMDHGEKGGNFNEQNAENNNKSS